MSSSKPRLDDLRIERRAKPDASGKGWWLLGLILVAALVAVGWWFTQSKKIEVRTAAAREASGSGGDRTVLNASGYVTARRAATVSSKVTGKIVEVLIEEGMKVKEGQVLARLDDTNVKANLNVAEAQLASAKAALEETRALLQQAQNDLRRTTELAGQHIASQSDLDTAVANANSLKARLDKQHSDVVVAQREVALWHQQMEDLVIRAPFDGIVTSKDAQPGEMISPVSAGGGFTRTGICTIVDMNSLEIEIDVNESYINRVESGQPVVATLDAYPDWKIPCKVIAIIPTADRQKATVKVRVGFDSLDPRILPEMAVKVAFQEVGEFSSGSRVVIVPKAAITNEGGQDVVFVVQDSTAERRAVTVSSSQGEDAMLSAGLSVGERVILNPPTTLADGTKVKVIEP